MSSPFSASLAFATFTTLFVTLLASLAIPVVNGQSAGLGLVQCAPAQVQVGGGSGPYTVSVLPAGADGQIATGAEPLETFPALNQSGVASWLVNVPSGTTVRLGVRDGTGAVSYSDPFTVQSGSSSDCLPAASSSASESAAPTSSAIVSSASSALSSSPFSSASSQPESSATTEGSSSRSGSVVSSASSSLLPFSSLTGSVTTQVSSSFPSSSTTTRPSTSSSSSARTTSSTSSTNELSSGGSSLRPYAGQLMMWLSAALLIFTNA